MLQMVDKPRSRTRDDVRELLSGTGLRTTGPRAAVLRELAKLRAPISHAELADRLAGTMLDRTTVYRNLQSLTEAGLLVRTQLGDKVWRFELPRSAARGHGLHPHFVCTDCGNVSCLPEKSVALRGTAKLNQVVEVQLRGLCAGCV
jgi:Fur family ferric uptake transcriptional regulator